MGSLKPYWNRQSTELLRTEVHKLGCKFNTYKNFELCIKTTSKAYYFNLTDVPPAMPFGTGIIELA